MNKGSGSFNKGKPSGGISKGSMGNQPNRPVGSPKPSTPVPGNRPPGTTRSGPPGPVSRPPVTPRPGTPVPTGQPSADILSQISNLQMMASGLQNSARLNQARDAVENVQTTVNGMVQRIANLRQNGYVFEQELENQADNFAGQWAALYPNIQQQLNMQSTTLMNSLRNLDSQMTQLNAQRNNPGMAQSLIGTINGSINMLQSQVSAAERTVAGMYDQFNSQVYQMNNRLGQIEQMLKEFAGATFQLLPTEGALNAVKAVYSPSGKEQKGDPEGTLFITDQRILFEQREEVVTKKVLFVATEKETVQKLLWEAPVFLVENVKISKQGMMKNEEHIDIQFSSGAPVYTVHMHIWQSAEEWQALINRARSREFDKTRAVGIDQAEVEKVKSLPSQCPSCGGNLDQVVLRGQDSVKCEYCGYTIRL